MATPKPTVSVIIPAYNASRTILETIESVQAQTFKYFEIIIINDGSTDKTLELISTVSDERLKIFSYENGGLCVARNRGISHAQGEFIAFLDADDLWTPDKLESQVKALRDNPDAKVVYSWTYFMDEQNDVRSISLGKPVGFEGDIYTKLLVNNFIASGSNVLIHREAVDSTGEFDLNCAGAADWDYWIRLAANYSFELVPKYQVYYRRSSGAMSSKIEKMRKDCLAVLEKSFLQAPLELQSLKQESLAWIYQYCTDLYLRYSSDLSGVRQGGISLFMSIVIKPKLLFKEHTQSLFKWFTKRYILLSVPALVRYW